jgi:hypothetical protein
VVFLKVETVMLIKGTVVLLVLVVLEHMRRSTNAARIETDRPSAYALWKADERLVFAT